MAHTRVRRLAVVLFNLGGPDSPEAVRPFLRNLFTDPAVIGLPWPVRAVLGRLLAARRAGEARRIYARIGGRSPLLANTQAQARALESALVARLGESWAVRCFVAMRYWHPLAMEVAETLAAWQADEIVLLPLYPQYSGTTTGSSLRDWSKAAAAVGLLPEPKAICCYPTQKGFIDALAALAEEGRRNLGGGGRARILFSAHGLPRRVVEAGDPYQWQVERTAAAVAERLHLAKESWTVCYQSRVGPLEWIRPYLEDELRRCAEDGMAAVVVPIAFVSEHSETLVELDMEFRAFAERIGVPAYVRAPTVGTETRFIAGLSDMVVATLAVGSGPRCGEAAEGGRRCPVRWTRCAVPVAAADGGGG